MNKIETLYLYGQLRMVVVGVKITKIKNVKGQDGSWFKKNVRLYNKLNNQLGITAYENSLRKDVAV